MFHSLLCCWWLNPRKVQRLARDFSWWSASGGLACSWPGSCPARSSHYLVARRGCASRWPPPTLPRSSIFRSPRLRWCSLKEFSFHFFLFQNPIPTYSWTGKDWTLPGEGKPGNYTEILSMVKFLCIWCNFLKEEKGYCDHFNLQHLLWWDSSANRWP